MTELEIHLLGIDQTVMQPLVVLREKTGDHRLLPIWLGAPEALAIARPADGDQVPGSPRSPTYDLLARIIRALGQEVEQIRIRAVRDGAFVAELRFDSGVGVACRGSDAVAVALNLGLPISAADEVLAEAGIPESAVLAAADPNGELDGDEPVWREAEIQRFREFLDTVGPQDFSVVAGQSSSVRPAPDRVRKRVIVDGTVQGVFFRDSCRDVARRHEVAGWVTNRSDGSVEAVFEGASDAVDTLVQWAGVGPTRADVRTVDVVDERPEGLVDFAVR